MAQNSWTCLNTPEMQKKVVSYHTFKRCLIGALLNVPLLAIL